MKLYFFYLIENALGRRTLYVINTITKKSAKSMIIDDYDYEPYHVEYVGLLPISYGHNDLSIHVHDLSTVLMVDDTKYL